MTALVGIGVGCRALRCNFECVSEVLNFKNMRYYWHFTPILLGDFRKYLVPFAMGAFSNGWGALVGLEMFNRVYDSTISKMASLLGPQFRRVANLYFLLAAALSLTYWAPFSPESVVAPLVLVVGISMLKEGVEDWHRFMQDLRVNSRTVKVHEGDGTFICKTWKMLKVGDVVKVEKNEYFPSDLLFISSSYEDGICYVDTMNLDGETHLKLKRCVEATLALDDDVEFSKFNATVRCEDPNPNLYSFVGNFEFEGMSYPLGPAQVLLRDSKLCNTEYVYGVVIFSGLDTKVVQNSTSSPSKRSRVERKMDKIIYILFSLLVMTSLITAVGSSLYTKSHVEKMWYLRVDKNESGHPFDPTKPLSSGALQLIRALILYGYLIPISLYVSIEIVKVLQAMLINKDIEMYDEVTCKSVEARTSNLNEELGQVQIILSDKTGTLTCNQMEFRKCSIAGISYGGDINEVDLAVSEQISADLERYCYSFDRSISYGALGSDVVKGFNFYDDRISNKMWTRSSNLSDVVMFFKVMALCHTGIAVENDGKGQLKYEAESPEEVAFLIAAQEFGFTFFRRTQSLLLLKEFDTSSLVEVEREYKLLNLLEFSSARMRMSVIVRDENNEIFLLCKGADSIIYSRLAENGKHYQQATTAHLSDYAEDGLRTLVFGYRKLEQEEYESWREIFTKAKTTMRPEREELLESASEMIEKELILLGAVAIEDKLQKGVPECIDKLAQAGLKIWLLTGDKKETAINIGFACSLLRHDMKQFHLCLGKEGKRRIQEMDMKEEILLQIRTAYQFIHEESKRNVPFALIIDGEALEHALRSDVKEHFLRLATDCASVICCRVSPKQKALVTRSVKEYTGGTILAIGDGANDVGMIQEADIGVGISGMEGMQAVMASDFSLPQFRYLERLLLVHGHWCYKRISKMILYFIYKNVAFGLTLFYVELCTSFSGGVIYDDWYMTLFNVALTSLPVISLGVLEQDVSSSVCQQFPALYQQGQQNIYFSWSRVVGWIMNGVYASLTIFTINIHAFASSSAFRDKGNVADIAILGAITYTCVIWTVNCQIALIINHFTWIHHFFIWGSIAFWYIFLYVYGEIPPAHSKGGFHLLKEALISAPTFWLVTLLVLVISLLPYFLHVAIQSLFIPMDNHVNITDNLIWLREQHHSRKKIHIGFSARVDAKIRQVKARFRGLIRTHQIEEMSKKKRSDNKREEREKKKRERKREDGESERREQRGEAPAHGQRLVATGARTAAPAPGGGAIAGKTTISDTEDAGEEGRCLSSGDDSGALLDQSIPDETQQ
ncbi:hypothetical protein Syun_028501 [Stephania yunnanensis]|uniref:Phospholipid-transporting ATPase n=1 Tax=Stephania yunnanensis TaxID=152371 RepID=A0AAP0EK13_9MAGN